MPASLTLIASRTNPRIKTLRAAFSGNGRIAGELVAVEGEHLLREAARSQLDIRTIFVTERFGTPQWLPSDVETVFVSEELLASAADTQQPQGIAALLRRPEWNLSFASVRNPLFLVAGGLQDPGNLGTLIRSAEAFCATAVLTSPGTVDPWNQKALRASAGSIFRMPVIPVRADDLISIRENGVAFFAAVAQDPKHDVLQADAADLTGSAALMVGNEGGGLKEDLLRLADARITIPMPGMVESLNAGVAGSLLLYEAARQRRRNRDEEAG